MRNKKGLLFSLTVLLLLLFGMPITANADAVELPIKVTLRNEEVKEFINYMNQKRVANSTDAYIVDSGLMEMAKERATDICVFFHHNSPLGTKRVRIAEYMDSYFGYKVNDYYTESIGVGIGNATGMYASWNSDAHQTSLISTLYKYCGVAAVDYYNTRYWVLLVSSIPVGNEISVSSIGNDADWTDMVQVDTAKLPAASTVNSVYYGTTGDVQLKARNKGDSFVATGYIWDSYTASVFSAKANNPDIFTVTSDGKIVPHKVRSEPER